MARSVKSRIKGVLTGAAHSRFEELHPRGPNGEFIDVVGEMSSIGAEPDLARGIWLVPRERRADLERLLARMNVTLLDVPKGMQPATEEDRKKLKIPPAWVDVWVATDAFTNPKAELLAIGTAANGKKQYRYSAYHEFHAHKEKFARIKLLDEHLDAVDDALKREAGTSDTAGAVMLIERLGLRPGSRTDTKARVQAYGATTLERRHVQVVGDTVRLDFIGKEGVHIKLETEDRDLARMLQRRIKGKRGDEPLFDTNEKKVNAWIDTYAPGHTAKDFRTHLATAHALALVKDMPIPADRKDFQRQRNYVGDQVSARLGNTRVMALGSYIDPAVFREWESADTVDAKYAAGQVVHWDTVEERLREVERYGLEDWPEKGPGAQKVLGDAKDTQEQHTVALPDGTRAYTAKRKTFHDRVIGQQLAKPLAGVLGIDHPYVQRLHEGGTLTPAERAEVRALVTAWRGGGPPRALFMAGGPASGKSTALRADPTLEPEHAVVINPDEYKEALPEYQRMIKLREKYAASGAHEESSDLGKRAQTEALALGLNVVVDGTGDSGLDKTTGQSKFVGKVQSLVDAGYDVSALYVTIPTDEAVVRSTLRAMGEGRWVPTPELRNQHKNVSANFLRVQEMRGLTSIKVYDNLKRDHLGNPVLIASGGRGRLNVHDQAAHTAFIAKKDE